MHSFYEPISYPRHARMRWSLPTRFEFARDLRLIPITLQEMRRAASFYPLCIRKTGNSIDLVAVLADASGRNLHLDSLGKWTSGYLPLMLRVHPFSLVRRAGDGRPWLAVTHEEGLFGLDGEHRLFLDNGQLSPASVTVFETLEAAEAQQPTLRAACEAIVAAGVITPVPPEALNGGLHRQRLFAIDPDHLDTLSTAQRSDYMSIYRSSPLALHLAEIILYSQKTFAFRPASSETIEGEYLKQIYPSPEEATTDKPAKQESDGFIDYGPTLDFGA